MMLQMSKSGLAINSKEEVRVDAVLLYLGIEAAYGKAGVHGCRDQSSVNVAKF